MKQTILNKAVNKFKVLSKKYNKFLNVIVDDWRGYRFIFDTEDVRRCKNDCTKCDLFKLLKKEKAGLWSAGLYPASNADKKLFGPQNFLNCKTLPQYTNCYANFIIKKANNKKILLAELGLIRQSTIIYSANNNPCALEKKFKNDIIDQVLNNTSGKKKQLFLETIYANKKNKKWFRSAKSS